MNRLLNFQCTVKFVYLPCQILQYKNTKKYNTMQELFLVFLKIIQKNQYIFQKTSNLLVIKYIYSLYVFYFIEVLCRFV